MILIIVTMVIVLTLLSNNHIFNLIAYIKQELWPPLFYNINSSVHWYICKLVFSVSEETYMKIILFFTELQVSILHCMSLKH